MYSGNYCRSNKINSLGPKKLLNSQIFDKRSTFPVKKRRWLFLSRIIEGHKPYRTIFKYRTNRYSDKYRESNKFDS